MRRSSPFFLKYPRAGAQQKAAVGALKFIHARRAAHDAYSTAAGAQMVEHGRGHVAVAQNILLLLLYNKLAAQKVQLALKRGPVCDGVRRVGDKHQLLQNGRLHFTGQVCQQQLAVGIAVRVHLIAHAGGNVPGSLPSIRCVTMTRPFVFSVLRHTVSPVAA